MRSAMLAARYDLLFPEAIGGNDFPDLRSTESQRASLVQEHRVHGSQRFQVEAAFNDGSLMRRSADGSEDCKRSSSRNAARSGDNHDRNG